MQVNLPALNLLLALAEIARLDSHAEGAWQALPFRGKGGGWVLKGRRDTRIREVFTVVNSRLSGIVKSRLAVIPCFWGSSFRPVAS